MLDLAPNALPEREAAPADPRMSDYRARPAM